MIIIKSLDYFLPDFSKGFLIGKQSIFYFYKYFLYCHIVGSPIVLLTGIFQFSLPKSKYHKLSGRVYIISVLFLAAPGALVMSFYSIDGVFSSLNFLLMSILWIFFSLKALFYIKKGNIEKHKHMMIRSFILTNSAIWIRILSYVDNQLHVFQPERGYLIISLSSWLPAIIVFELITHKQQII
ncbi:MAG: DUF2306 domain-containing protein [Cyclobacteriaceae bacterium]